jgi:hypothetical protein
VANLQEERDLNLHRNDVLKVGTITTVAFLLVAAAVVDPEVEGPNLHPYSNNEKNNDVVRTHRGFGHDDKVQAENERNDPKIAADLQLWCPPNQKMDDIPYHQHGQVERKLLLLLLHQNLHHHVVNDRNQCPEHSAA